MPTTDPTLRSFIHAPPESPFPIQNLPYGIFRERPSAVARAGIAIGDFVLDLALLEARGFFEHPAFQQQHPFSHPSLNPFMAMERAVHVATRNTLSHLLRVDTPTLRDDVDLRSQAFHRIADVELLCPVEIGDYTDFYSSKEHALNVGTMFRGKDRALMDNWLHLPIGYHGRASSIVVSGTPICRPHGQIKPEEGPPRHAPSQLLDFELEMGFLIGKGTSLGTTVPISQAKDHIFGMMLVNDWSARDIQKWEYVPLGPFLGKNFATTISPWVVTLDALAPFRCTGPEQNPTPLPYLQSPEDLAYNIHLEVGILSPAMETPTRVCRSNYRYLYWNMAQQLAHHTVNGCNLRTGDLLASGTISGPTPDSYGSLLELSWRGTRHLSLSDGTRRTFLQDGDTVVMTGWAQGDGYRVGFGTASGRVLP